MTQLYQSEALIGATLLSLFTLSLFLPHIQSPPRATWIGVYVPPQVLYSMYKDGEEGGVDGGGRGEGGGGGGYYLSTTSRREV